MKKILFLLVLIYNYSFSAQISISASVFASALQTYTFTSVTFTSSTNASCNNDTVYYLSNNADYLKVISSGSFNTAVNDCRGRTHVIKYNQRTVSGTPYTCTDSFINDNGNIYSCTNGDFAPVPNPDPLGGTQCRDLFQKDGVAYTCNPNTNQATPIPNSDGTILDPDTGSDKPNCSAGYSYTNMPNMSSDGSGTGYYTHSCTAIPVTPPPTDTGTTPTVTTNADGSKTWTAPDGNSYHLTPNGTLTTTYSDGSTSVSQVGSNYGAGSSSGGSGSSGGGTGGTSGNTTNEDNTTPPTDTPIDNTPVANSCTDSALTLQEKMLCELNAGMKKQNSEGAPENSLNQLLKDLKTSNQTDNTAINTNLKDVKALQENQLNKQTQANATLEKINDSANATELYNKVMTEDLNKLVNNTQDAEGKSYLGTITDFVKTLTTPVSGDDKSSYSNQINSNVNSSLGSTLSKYSNVLGFGSTYANRPENITMTIFNQQYTLIDFSILDSYISIIRSLFLTLAYLYGFMNLIRSSN